MKTQVIFTQLIARIPPHRQGAEQTLILVHRRELVEQAARHCSMAYPSKSIEIEMASNHASGNADITVASVQSITSGDRMEKFDPSRFKLILVDEAHHIVAPKYMEALEYFRLSPPDVSSPALVGVSATMSRFDGVKLGAALDHIVYHKDYVDMIGEKWLSQVIFTTVQSQANLSKVASSSTGDFLVGQLSKAVNNPETNEITVRAWLAKARNRKSTIVFCVDVAHIIALTAAFRRHGIDARYVTGTTKKTSRSEKLEAFRNGEFPVLINCGVFTEGTDIPNIDCVILARPTKSRNLLVQMIGRGMRLHPGKENCHILDMVASLETGIVTTPTLFGLDPSELVENAGVAEMATLKAQKQKERGMVQDTLQSRSANTSAEPLSQKLDRTVTFTDYDSVHDLIEDTSGERHIRAISPLAWVQVQEDKYVLSTQSGDFLTIEAFSSASSDGFKVRHTPRNSGETAERSSKAPFLRPREIASTGLFADAVHAADTFANKMFEWIFISKNQEWRKRPASESQIAFLNRFRDAAHQLTPETVTKGQAGDMITKIKHGARGRYERISSAKRKERRVRDRESAMRSKEAVQIGPVAS